MTLPEKKRYDVIASLGGTCDVANQLRSRGLRRHAYPLDWIGFCDWKSLRYFPEGIRTGFRDFCLKENLEPMPKTDIGMGGTTEYHYHDRKTGWLFVHQFEEPKEKPGVWEKIHGDFVRRWKRFFADMDAAKSALLILDTWKPFDPALADAVYEAFRERFPQTRIDMRVIQFSCEEDAADPERWGGGFYRYRRARHFYDWNATSVEWDFLDRVAFTADRPLSRLDKIIRKIWKHCWNHLRHRGVNVGSGSI